MSWRSSSHFVESGFFLSEKIQHDRSCFGFLFGDNIIGDISQRWPDIGNRLMFEGRCPFLGEIIKVLFVFFKSMMVLKWHFVCLWLNFKMIIVLRINGWYLYLRFCEYNWYF